MNEHAVNAVNACHLEQRIQMGLLRMDAAIGEQSEQVELATGGLRMFHRREQDGVGEEVTLLDHQVDARNVHVDDAPGPNVQVSYLTVPHLSGR
jgi:hypothetical protein